MSRDIQVGPELHLGWWTRFPSPPIRTQTLMEVLNSFIPSFQSWVREWPRTGKNSLIQFIYFWQTVLYSVGTSLARAGCGSGAQPAIGHALMPPHAFSFNSLKVGPPPCLSSQLHGPTGYLPCMVDSRGATVIPRNRLQKLEKIKDSNRQSRQLEELTGKMRECKTGQ